MKNVDNGIYENNGYTVIKQKSECNKSGYSYGIYKGELLEVVDTLKQAQNWTKKTEIKTGGQNNESNQRIRKYGK